ncbi:MAG: proteasome assembly chaperone family protein [Candidatus Micrarchaeota archaeon]|nr:proteasome assembly chaperone family protein [Candidatus Micrarchaeota archaeon]
MRETKIFVKERPKLRDPVLVVGVPGKGNVGRVAVGYLVHKLNAKLFAELYSPFFFHFVMIHDNLLHVPRNEFYYHKGKKRDFIFLIGDCQTYDPKGHYEISGKILNFVSEFGCKEVITIAGFETGRIVEKPSVLGTATHPELVEKLKKYDIDFNTSKQVGTIVGTAGMLAGLSKLYGMKGMCLLGETSGFPIVTDPNAAEAVLERLQKILGLKVDLTQLKEKVKEMHEFIKKIEVLQEEAMRQLKAKYKKSEELKYIG